MPTSRTQNTKNTSIVLMRFDRYSAYFQAVLNDSESGVKKSVIKVPHALG